MTEADQLIERALETTDSWPTLSNAMACVNCDVIFGTPSDHGTQLSCPHCSSALSLLNIADILSGRAKRQEPDTVARMIREECDSVRDLLLEKNRKYGNSALEPRRLFSKAGAVEQILVRIDDKISRIATTGFEGADEGTLQDLIGYLVLLRIARRMER